ncbi:MAG: hypothetical protein JSU61_02390 [Fidelibacterota bacterium]|nr:MAG: hypothetical protein JSU61_02390 [Candidatus Neomarinimicrobiota bacterium]
MNAAWLRMACVAAVFLLVFATGFWLKALGRPYGVALMTVHKLAATGILFYLLIQAVGANKLSALSASMWIVVSLATLSFLIMIASGGALSAMKSPPAIISVVHQVAPYTTVLFSIVAFLGILW